MITYCNNNNADDCIDNVCIVPIPARYSQIFFANHKCDISAKDIV